MDLWLIILIIELKLSALLKSIKNYAYLKANFSFFLQ